MLNQTEIDRVFHALGDPTRRRLLERLSRGPASVSDLAKPLGITLAAVVQHLQVLERSGLVRTRKVGRVRTCRIEPAGLDVAAEWIAERRSLWERRLDRLGDVLAEEERPAGRPTKESGEYRDGHIDEPGLRGPRHLQHRADVPARPPRACSPRSRTRRPSAAGSRRARAGRSTSSPWTSASAAVSSRASASRVAPRCATTRSTSTSCPTGASCFAYTMMVGDERISASLATVEISPSGEGSRLVYTEQGAFFDGADKPEEREAGCRELFEKLGEELRGRL